MADEIIETIEEIEEELFPPKPGGIVDRHRKRKAEQEAAAEEARNSGEAVQEQAYKAVKVAVEQPETISAQTLVIAPGASSMILPALQFRKRAVISVIPTNGDTTASVLIARDQGAAIGLNGFQLFNGQLLEIESRAQVWAMNPVSSANNVMVSVLSEFYAAENKR